MSWSVEAEHEFILCRMVDWNYQWTDANQDSAEDGKFKAPDQTISGIKDRTVVLEVMSRGPGNVSRGTRNPCHLNHGDLIVANMFHKCYEPKLMGDNLYVFKWEDIMVQLYKNEIVDLKTKEKKMQIDMTPLQAFLILERDEDLANELIMGEGRLIRNPHGDIQNATETLSGVDSRTGKKHVVCPIKTAIERVVAVGPGAVIDGMWQEPPQMAGDMVMYDTSTTPVRFMLRGKSFTLVNYRSVLMTFRKNEVECAQVINS